ncbi:hypothetical protein GTO89_06465 [Heliobacterium gestii]|uniref:Uncharacterized protein n=1 Tax=Heliomicrobium gestii TaxID=2699 RepID=A0A845LAT5_HELGE|nr:hypothetical protein [Heliomicrobium gestii]MBM7865986.1 hypothetical protein [Heliomicrobium gestii]MZP42681.1 hypothetical protein [Heliomicrobium gestii]
MLLLNQWLYDAPEYSFEPLFSVSKDLCVATKYSKSTEKKLLVRSPEIERAIISTVKKGVQRDDWEGILFILGTGLLPKFQGIMISITDRQGIKNEVNENIKNIQSNYNKFARWGDGLDYHIGDLSHAMFQFEAYREPKKRYLSLAQQLFSSFEPPVLKSQVYLYVLPWYADSVGPSGVRQSLKELKKEIAYIIGGTQVVA